MLAKTIDHPIVAAMQRRHFVLLDIVPFVSTVLACVILVRVGVQPADWCIFGLFYVAGVVGIELGYHRYFSHAAFEASPAMRAALLILGAMGGQGPVITWASTHRYHHAHSDGPQDVHSPHAFRDSPRPSARSLLHAQLTWKWHYPYPNPSLYTPHLVRDPMIVRLSRLYYLWVALGILAPGVLSWMLSRQPASLLTGALLGGVVRLFATQQLTFLINSLCHLVGARPFISRDQSRNVWLLSPLTLGGSLHNTHHAFPTTANNALMRWDFDPGFWLLRVFSALGLVSKLKTVPAHIVARRRRDASGDNFEPESVAGMGEGPAETHIA